MIALQQNDQRELLEDIIAQKLLWIELVIDWPNMQHLPEITLVQKCLMMQQWCRMIAWQRPCLCGVENSFGISVYYKEFAF